MKTHKEPVQPARHTPGPWRIGSRDGFNCCNIMAHIAPERKDGQQKYYDPVICSVIGLPLHTDTEQMRRLPADRYGEAIANAALICAAPAMLEALKYANDMLDSFEGPSSRKFRAMYQAIIAQAEGRA